VSLLESDSAIRALDPLKGGRVDTQHQSPQRAPNKPRRPGDLSWIRLALQVIQTAATLIRTWHVL
jgi:hypothetical protein